MSNLEIFSRWLKEEKVIRNFGRWRHIFWKSHMKKCHLQNFSLQSKKLSEIGGNASLSHGGWTPLLQSHLQPLPFGIDYLWRYDYCQWVTRLCSLCYSNASYITVGLSRLWVGLLRRRYINSQNEWMIHNSFLHGIEPTAEVFVRCSNTSAFFTKHLNTHNF